MIDSNAIDVIADESTLFAALKSAVETGDLDLVWTHISVEELLQIPDEDRRARLILAGMQLARLVPTSNLITDTSRFDLASFSPDNDADGFEAYRRGRVRQTHDALIVTTAEGLGFRLPHVTKA